MTNENNADELKPVELATRLTTAWLANPSTRTDVEDVPAFLDAMHAAIMNLAADTASVQAEAEAPQQYAPAVSVRKSLASADHIVSMIDGKAYRTLRRHLSTHGLTPEEYRARYNLRADYPMVAKSYSESRRAMAKKIGLGRKPGVEASAAKSKKNRTGRESTKAPALDE